MQRQYGYIYLFLILSLSRNPLSCSLQIYHKIADKWSPADQRLLVHALERMYRLMAASNHDFERLIQSHQVSL